MSKLSFLLIRLILANAYSELYKYGVNSASIIAKKFVFHFHLLFLNKRTTIPNVSTAFFYHEHSLCIATCICVIGRSLSFILFTSFTSKMKKKTLVDTDVELSHIL